MLTDALNHLAASVENEIDRLNWGGCCVFAALVGRELQKRGYDVKGVVAGGSWGNGSDLDEVRKNVANPFDKEEWDNNGIDFGHVGLRLETDKGPMHYDSAGLSTRLDRIGSTGGVYDGYLTVEELEALAAEEDGWNWMFDRQQIPKLERLVHNHLENL